MGYTALEEFRVSIAFLQHSNRINPPRVLEENDLIPANVISNECPSRTSSWGGKCCKGGLDDVVVSTDGDDQKILFLAAEFIDKAGGSIKLMGFGCSDTGVRTSQFGFCMIITNKEVEKVRILIEKYWLSKDSTAMVPLDNSSKIVDDENEEHVGPKL
jgi:hypothetical protein